MSSRQHNPNVELMAQGVAKPILSPLVGGLPATGAIARTGQTFARARRRPGGNDSCTDATRDHFVCGTVSEDVPLAALAAIFLMVAYNGPTGRDPEILKLSKADIASGC